MTEARPYLCRPVRVEGYEIFNYLAVIKIVGMPDLGLCCWFEILYLKHISHRERPNRNDSNVRGWAIEHPRTIDT